MADPVLKWEPDPDVPLKGAITVSGVTKTYRLLWGDGDVVNDGQPGRSYEHTYDKAGPYTAALIAAGDTKPSVYAAYRVLAADEKLFEVTQVPGSYSVAVRFKEPAGPVAPRYSIQWTNKDATDITVTKGGQETSYWYGSSGPKKLRVTDHWSNRVSFHRVTLTEPVIDPDILLVENPNDTSRYTVELAVKHASGTGKLEIHWGDGTEWEQIDAVTGRTASRKMDLPGEYAIRARYADDHSKFALAWATVPFTD